MQNIHIAGTGIWYPDNLITNDELVNSFNTYVDHFNQANEKDIKDGNTFTHEQVMKEINDVYDM